MPPTRFDEHQQLILPLLLFRFGSIVERVSAATGAIAARVEQLSGSSVSRVSIRVSGLEIDQEGRVS